MCETDEDGIYVVECTDFPGCLSEGHTLDEAIDNINETIVGCLKSRLKCAKDNFLKKGAPNFHDRMNILLDTTKTTEYT
ncbi:MAG: type II toxin-antitoxin system HicB family antitoxin [Methanosarcinaceae archaeon]